jgi:WD40 repeat protein
MSGFEGKEEGEPQQEELFEWGGEGGEPGWQAVAGVPVPDLLSIIPTRLSTVWHSAAFCTSPTETGERRHRVAFASTETGSRSGHAGLILVWEVGSGQGLTSLRGHKSHITSLLAIDSFSDGRSALASVCLDGTLRLWDGDTLEPLHTLAVPGATEAGGYHHNMCAFTEHASGSPRLAVIAGCDVHIYDPEAGTHLTQIHESPRGGPDDDTFQVAASVQSLEGGPPRLAVAGPQGYLRVS